MKRPPHEFRWMRQQKHLLSEPRAPVAPSCVAKIGYEETVKKVYETIQVGKGKRTRSTGTENTFVVLTTRNCQSPQAVELCLVKLRVLLRCVSSYSQFLPPCYTSVFARLRCFFHSAHRRYVGLLTRELVAAADICAIAATTDSRRHSRLSCGGVHNLGATKRVPKRVTETVATCKVSASWQTYWLSDITRYAKML